MSEIPALPTVPRSYSFCKKKFNVIHYTVYSLLYCKTEKYWTFGTQGGGGGGGGVLAGSGGGVVAVRKLVIQLERGNSKS